MKRRADAERNVQVILDAAMTCFADSVDAPMTEIAKAAGVSRVTLYAHFPSREALLQALLERTLAEIDTALRQAEPERGPAEQAMVRLLHAPWLSVHFTGVYAAAVRHLGADHVRQMHNPVFEHVDRLLTRGQDEGVFRADLPRHWLATSVYTLAHAAVAEADQGRLPFEEAAEVLTASVLGLLRPPTGRPATVEPRTATAPPSSAPRPAPRPSP